MNQNNKSGRTSQVSKLIDHLYRKEYGKIVAFLTSSFGFGHVENAEDIVQETMASAFTFWNSNGIPENPEGWLFKTARNKALNFIKSEKIKERVYSDTSVLEPDAENPNIEAFDSKIKDSMLRMIFACCHPSIPVENQIVLILKTLCGFSRKEIAGALLAEEESIKKKLFRAKKEIREKNIELGVLDEKQIPERLNTVCSCLYLLFNEGYNSSHTDNLIRKDLCLEAISLIQLLVEQLPSNTKVKALLALMCFHTARFESRQDDKGAIILFAEQNRNLWNQDLIDRGLYYLSEACKGVEMSTYHLEASIAAEHCTATDFKSTDWKLIHQLYEHLYLQKKNPIILLNLAIISSQLNGIDHAIKELEELSKKEKALAKYYLLHATLGEFYKLNDQKVLAQQHFETALKLTDSEKEKTLLKEKISDLKTI